MAAVQAQDPRWTLRFRVRLPTWDAQGRERPLEQTQDQELHLMAYRSWFTRNPGNRPVPIVLHLQSEGARRGYRVRNWMTFGMPAQNWPGTVTSAPWLWRINDGSGAPFLHELARRPDGGNGNDGGGGGGGPGTAGNAGNRLINLLRRAVPRNNNGNNESPLQRSIRLLRQIRHVVWSTDRQGRVRAILNQNFDLRDPDSVYYPHHLLLVGSTGALLSERHLQFLRSNRRRRRRRQYMLINKQAFVLGVVSYLGYEIGYETTRRMLEKISN